MGMIANYQASTDVELEKIRSFEDVEEMQEDEDEDLEVCDIDKMWDALHFILTGKSATEPIEDDLLSEAIVGQDVICEEDFIAGISAKRVQEIAKCLQNIDFQQYMATFDMKKFEKNGIYPDIWEYEEEEEEIKEEMVDSFERLKDFYTKMAAQNRAVLVSIY